MELLKGLTNEGLALYIKKEDTIVFSDVHIGLEEAMNKQGTMMPRIQLKGFIEYMEPKLTEIKPKKIVIAGDLKHEFGEISDQEWKDTLKVLDFLGSHCDELVLIKGNHDSVLGPIADRRNLKIDDHLLLGDIFICHGHIKPDKGENDLYSSDFIKAKTIIMGHEHPAISIRDAARSEIFKCFLVGEIADKKKIIILPSTNFVSEGIDILEGKRLSPILAKTDIEGFEVYIIADETLHFGKVGEIRKINSRMRSR